MQLFPLAPVSRGRYGVRLLRPRTHQVFFVVRTMAVTPMTDKRLPLMIINTDVSVGESVEIGETWELKDSVTLIPTTIMTTPLPSLTSESNLFTKTPSTNSREESNRLSGSVSASK